MFTLRKLQRLLKSQSTPVQVFVATCVFFLLLMVNQFVLQMRHDSGLGDVNDNDNGQLKDQTSRDGSRNIQSNPAQPSAVEYYSASEHASNLASDPSASLHCQPVHQNDYTMCLYPPRQDYISDYLRKHGSWEADISELLLKATRAFPNSVFVDVGANLGVHSLYVASKGQRVRAVEPLKSNLVRFHSSVERMKPTPSLRIVKNALSNVRTTVSMDTGNKNFGNSKISDAGGQKSQKNLVNTVRLDDVFQSFVKDPALPPQPDKLNLVLKVDIETRECEVLLGAPNALNQNPHYFVPLLVMEWRFRESWEVCSAEQLREMTGVLTGAGYVPYKVTEKVRLNPEVSHTDWPIMDMVWVHGSVEEKVTGLIYYY